jgi:hypothetical protein
MEDDQQWQEAQPSDGSGGESTLTESESGSSEEAAGEDPWGAPAAEDDEFMEDANAPAGEGLGGALLAEDDGFMEDANPAAVPPPAPSDEEDLDIEDLLQE